MTDESCPQLIARRPDGVCNWWAAVNIHIHMGRLCGPGHESSVRGVVQSRQGAYAKNGLCNLGTPTDSQQSIKPFGFPTCRQCYSSDMPQQISAAGPVCLELCRHLLGIAQLTGLALRRLPIVTLANCRGAGQARERSLRDRQACTGQLEGGASRTRQEAGARRGGAGRGGEGQGELGAGGWCWGLGDLGRGFGVGACIGFRGWGGGPHSRSRRTTRPRGCRRAPAPPPRRRTP